MFRIPCVNQENFDFYNVKYPTDIALNQGSIEPWFIKSWCCFESKLTSMLELGVVGFSRWWIIEYFRVFDSKNIFHIFSTWNASSNYFIPMKFQKILQF